MANKTGRISQYHNEKTPFSREIFEKIPLINAVSIDDIENFQIKNGISNADLSRLSGYNAGHIADWKKGNNVMPDRVKQHFLLLFQEFERLNTF